MIDLVAMQPKQKTKNAGVASGFEPEFSGSMHPVLPLELGDNSIFIPFFNEYIIANFSNDFLIL